uniref:Uncharacterized protein n=1 Tax=Oryza glumipatula TaxID=40148 RepID=A0A0D9Y8G2_9ORYZ
MRIHVLTGNSVPLRVSKNEDVSRFAFLILVNAKGTSSTGTFLVLVTSLRTFTLAYLNILEES